MDTTHTSNPEPPLGPGFFMTIQEHQSHIFDEWIKILTLVHPRDLPIA